METSKEIIKQAKQRFKDLKHKKYDEPSFFAGFLEAKALGMKKDFEAKKFKAFCEHLNTCKGLEDFEKVMKVMEEQFNYSSEVQEDEKDYIKDLIESTKIALNINKF